MTLKYVEAGEVDDGEHEEVIEKLEKDQAAPLDHHLFEVALVDEQGIGGGGGGSRVLPVGGKSSIK